MFKNAEFPILSNLVENSQIEDNKEIITFQKKFIDESCKKDIKKGV